MERRFKTVDAYLTALLKRPDELRVFNVSPGWAVEALGVTRQRVAAMIERGIFDSVRTDDGIVLLKRAEVIGYKRLRGKHTRREFSLVAKRWIEAKREREKAAIAFGNSHAYSPANHDAL